MAAEIHTAVDDFVAPVCDELVVILYQDADILLISKPSGLLSLSGKNPLNCDSVHHRLVHGQDGVSPALPEAKLPHRLDFGTLLIICLTANLILFELAEAFLNRLLLSFHIVVFHVFFNDLPPNTIRVPSRFPSI